MLSLSNSDSGLDLQPSKNLYVKKNFAPLPPVLSLIFLDMVTYEYGITVNVTTNPLGVSGGMPPWIEGI